MKNKIKYSFLIISIFILINFGQGCQKNPATGDSEFNLLSESEEDAIGRSEHQKIIKQFGGEYQNIKLKKCILKRKLVLSQRYGTLLIQR